MISVVIPVYNVEKYLRECINSVLQQTYTDYEIILVDDGSTDSSGLICDEYLDVSDKVRVIHQQNGGLSAARNTGLNAAIGEYIYFLDSDDYIESYALEHLEKIAEKEQADVVFFDGYTFFTDCEEDPNAMNYKRSKKYSRGNGRKMLLELLQTDEYRTVVQLLFFRREYLILNNLSFKEGIIHEDELFTFLAYEANGIVTHCHEQLYARRIRPASIMTSTKMKKRYDSMLTIYYEIVERYKNKMVVGEAAQLYLIRTAKSVIAKYNLLPTEERKEIEIQHDQFKNSILKNRGFGDIKLKIKCSEGIANIMYRIEYKIMSSFQKG